MAGVALGPAPGASAQFEEPCGVACAGVLGAAAFVTATGASIGMGRGAGGLSSVNEGLLVWAGTFSAFVGGGIALSGNGERQERAIYAAGIGTMAGAVIGLALEAARSGADEPRVFAGALIGAAAGAVLAGVYGAVSYETGRGTGDMPLFSVRVPL
jgi:hypothetical protein